MISALSDLDCVFVNLQYGDADQEIDGAADLLEQIDFYRDDAVQQSGDFDPIAAQLCALDGVVSISTTIVHMAASLEVPATVLLPAKFSRNLFWYWSHCSGASSQVYPSVNRLYCETEGDWTLPLEQARTWVEGLEKRT